MYKNFSGSTGYIRSCGTPHFKNNREGQNYSTIANLLKFWYIIIIKVFLLKIFVVGKGKGFHGIQCFSSFKQTAHTRYMQQKLNFSVLKSYCNIKTEPGALPSRFCLPPQVDPHR